MTFREILARVIDPTPGALAGAVMCSDGVAIDEYRRPEAQIDLNTVTVEFQLVLEQARKVAGALYGQGSGGLEELILKTPGHQLLFREIDEEYFLVVALRHDGMLGKARYLVNALLHKIEEAL